jgi:uncharacterized protein
MTMYSDLSLPPTDLEALPERQRWPFWMKNVSEEGWFSGYASVFGVRDAQADVVLPGAFRESVAASKRSGAWPKLLWQHQPSAPIGQIIRLEEDAYGLYLEAQLLLDVCQGREAYSLLKAGVIDRLSIGYEVVEASADEQRQTRRLHQVKLWEVSLVTFPANHAARVTQVKHRDPWGMVLSGLRKAAGVLQPIDGATHAIA